MSNPFFCDHYFEARAFNVEAGKYDDPNESTISLHPRFCYI